VPERVTEVTGEQEDCLYKRISLEYSSTWPGQVYLRFEPFGSEAAHMIRVMPGDIVSISNLAGPYTTKSDIRDQVIREIADMEPGERAHVLSTYRHPSGRPMPQRPSDPVDMKGDILEANFRVRFMHGEHECVGSIIRFEDFQGPVHRVVIKPDDADHEVKVFSDAVVRDRSGR